MSGSQRVATGIFVSRVVGLLREVVIGIALGGGPVADAFRGAMRIPNLLQNLLGEGSISAAFVPVYARLVEEQRHEDANRLARQTLGVLSAVVVLLVALIVLAARPMVWLTTLGGWSGDRYELTIELTRLTALGMGFLVLSAWCLGILNAHRRYLLSYTAPVLWSAAQILGLGLALLLVEPVAPGGDEIGLASSAAASIARWGAVAMVVGSLGQLAVQIPTVRRVGGAGPPSLTIGPELREVLGRFVPAVGGRGVVQLGSYVDLALAGLLAAGALATLSYIMPLYLLSIAVFGFSVAVSELTEMSRTTSGLEAVAARVRLAQRRVLLPAGLVTAGALGGGSIVIGLLYEDLNRLFGGDDATTRFGADNTTVAAVALAAFALGLPATMVARVNQNALYALGDVKGPARIAAVRLAVAVVVGFLTMIQLDHLAATDIDDAVATVITNSRLVPDDATTGQVRSLVEAGLGGEIRSGPFGTTSIAGFPHWPPWEPLPNREAFGSNLSDNPGVAPLGTAFVHFGVVGLGLGSAVASWTEWALLRRRLRRHLVGQSITTGLGRWVAMAGFAAFVVARAVSALGLPPVIDLVVLGVAVVGTYIGALWFVGLRPTST